MSGGGHPAHGGDGDRNGFERSEWDVGEGSVMEMRTDERERKVSVRERRGEARRDRQIEREPE